MNKQQYELTPEEITALQNASPEEIFETFQTLSKDKEFLKELVVIMTKSFVRGVVSNL